MSDVPHGQYPGQTPSEDPENEDGVRRLFAARMPPVVLPPDAAERLVQRVQGEVRQVYAPRPPVTVVHNPSWFERFRLWAGSLRPVQSLALAGATALALMLLLLGVSRLMPRPLSALAQVAAGDVMVLREHNGSFRVFHDGDLLRLQKGDQVITDGGVVTVTHFPSQVAIVEPGSHVKLEELGEADGGTQVAMYVYDGAVHSTVDEPLGANDRFVIRAPNVEVEAHGTEFTVEAITDEQALVTTVEGEVEVQTDGQLVEVGAGESLNIAEGEPLVVAPAKAESDHKRPLLLVALAIGKLLKIHTTPDAASSVIGEVTADLTFTVEAQDDTGQWYRVCCVAGKEGWIHLPRLAPSE